MFKLRFAPFRKSCKLFMRPKLMYRGREDRRRLLAISAGVSQAPGLRVEFLLKTDSGYPKDTGVNKLWQPLRIPFAITPIG